jgi:ankyrin repeat protein
MKLFSYPKLSVVFLSLLPLLVGCSTSTDPNAEMKSAMRRAVEIYYGESDEENIQPALEQIRQAVVGGADPNLEYEEMTPMYLAIMGHDTALAATLIDHGAPVEASDMDKDGEPDNYPPLLDAIKDTDEVNPEMIALFIKAGAKVDSNGDFQPPLEAAVEINSLPIAIMLLEAGADPNGHEEWSSPLHTAANEGNVELFDLLLTYGAEVQDSGELLAAAANSSIPEMVRRILPLHTGPKEVPDLFLMAAGNLLDNDDEEYEASKKLTLIIMEELRAAGFQPAPGEFDEILVTAAEYGTLRLEELETMLEYGASAKAANDSGETCLMLIIKSASIGNMMESEIGPKGMFNHQDTNVKELVRFLLEHGAEVNLQDSNGRTALMHAATTFNLTAVRQLMEKGADKHLVDKKGSTAEQQMLAMGLLKDDKKDKAGRIMQSMFGITPEFKAQARKRAQQIQVEFGSDPSALPVPTPPSQPETDAKPISKPG